ETISRLEKNLQGIDSVTKMLSAGDTPEQMLETALARGFDSLGFSGHAPAPFDPAAMSPAHLFAYIKDIRSLPALIPVYLGIEEDLDSRVDQPEQFDFIIGSVHFLPQGDGLKSIDYTREQFIGLLEDTYGGSMPAMARAYYDKVSQLAGCTEVDIAGHIDLIAKFNEHEDFFRFDDPVYLSYACQAVDCLAPAKIIEVNTGAMARGYRSRPYPDIHLLQYMYEKKAKICLCSDCHDRSFLDYGFAEALQLIRWCGFRSLMILTPDGFREEDIDRF
ncbi:MAG: hypothetical protein IIY72_04095, partial [Solobacterium sp.]|nr:hypothetical protein [Solobacterium sp.]